ncbi:MAG: NACHT domain-containing protein [Gammaproteobacteria bacterium]|nr:NACHT domain-containing protein [Gammaproteobacteria bacterium]
MIPAQKHLLKCIRDLDETGDLGFEEFAHDMISELSSERFHLVSSGRQHGADVRSDPINKSRVHIECKRYVKSPLPVGTLKAKLVDAASSNKQIDTWILVSTKDVDASARDELHEVGLRFGVGVCVFDTSATQSSLCDLVVFAANAPIVCRKYFAENSKAEEAVQTIRNLSAFNGRLDQLKKTLQHSSLFYENACKMSRVWLTESQSTVEHSKSRLGGIHNLDDPNEVVISRKNLLDSIESWYLESDRILAVLGDEGMGKSWLVLNWVNELLSRIDQHLLTIYVPATNIEVDVHTTIAAALARMGAKNLRASDSNEEFWKRKVTLWESSDQKPVSVLFIIDGLNQHIHFKAWASWLQPLLEPELGIRYRVVITCWPLWWTKDLFALQSLTPPPEELNVGGFEDEELNALLKHVCISRCKFSQPVIDLMKSPRLAKLSIKHHNALQDSGDITAARLVYEDHKETYKSRHRRAGLTDSEFREIITQLGQKIRTDFNKKISSTEVAEILKNITYVTGENLVATINDLSAGSWLRPSDRLGKFQVVQEKVPMVIGLTLAAEVANFDADTASKALCEFLDPLKSHSFGAQILIAALTFSLVDSDIGLPGQSAILHNLLQHQNFSQREFEELWRIVGLDSYLFLDFAQSVWLDANTGHFLDEVLIKTFVASAAYPNVLQALTVRLTDWLSVVWTRTQTEFNKHERSNQFSQLNIEICFNDNSGWSWLSYRTLQILAHLPNDSIQKPLLAWSISRAIMQEKHHADIVKWMLRWKTRGTNECYKEIQKARSLLTLVASSVTRRASSYLSAVTSHTKKSRKTFANSEPSERQTYESFSTKTRLDLVIRNMLKNKSWLRKELANSPIKVLNQRLSNKSKLDNTVFDLILRNLECLLFILTERSREKVYSEVELRLKNCPPTTEEDREVVSRLKVAKHIFDLYNTTSPKQAQLRLATGFQLCTQFPINSYDNFHRLYRSSRFEQSKNTEIINASTQGLQCWLDFYRFSRNPSDTSTLPLAKELVLHEDIEVRVRSLVIAINSSDTEAINRFLESKFVNEIPSENSYQDFRYKLVYEQVRSIAILKQCDFSLDVALTKKIRHDAICELVNRRHKEQLVLEEYNKYLKQQFSLLDTEKSYSSDNYIFDQTEAITHLLNFDKQCVTEWLVSWIKHNHTLIRLGRVFMGESPVINMMEALVDVDPNVSLDMFEKLETALTHSLYSSHRFTFFPFRRFSLSERCIEMREKHKDKIKCDKEILDLTCYIFKYGDTDWLYKKINEYLNASSVWHLALGYTLLGYCDESTEADQLWDQCTTRPPIDKWLLRVFRKSFDSYSQNKLCRKSLKKFWTTKDRLVAFRCLRFIEEFCDTRIKLWINPLSPENLADFHDGFNYEKNVACGYLVDRINKDANNRDRELKNVLFHTRKGPSFMPPWS